MPPNVSSPTMMTTPKPHSSSLKPSGENGDEAVRSVPGVGASAVIGEEEDVGGQRQGGDEEKVAAVTGDGRITPTGEAAPSAGSAGASTSASSAPSSAALPDPPSPNPTTISSLSATTFSSQPAAPGLPHAAAPTFNATVSHPAETGMGSLHGEEQLKSALNSKDRMFVLVLANEVEAFIGRIATGQVAAGGAGGAGSSTSVVAALGPSTPLGATPTSKFQRMLVYKAAEWYGLKAAPGPEGSMIIGVLGTFYEKSNSLRLSDLVPAAPSPTQKFRIMQRAPTAASNPSDAGPADGPSAEPRSKWKTLEEREAAYAAAREKFLGKDGEVQAAAPKTEETSRAAAGLQDDIDPVPRRRPYPNGGGGGGAGFEPVYPSLYRPAKSPHHSHGHSPGPAQGMQEYPPQQQAGYFQNGMYPAYPVDMYGNPVMGAGAGGAYPGAGGHQPQAGYMPPFMDGGQYVMMPPGGQQGGYQIPGWQAQQAGGAYPQQMMGQNGQYGMMQQQQQTGGQWAYTPMMGGGQPMPMIPQGMPYHAPAFYPQQVQGQVPGQPLPQMQQQRQLPQQQQYPQLAQPTPTRPQPQPHSSASSSISSRSYQDGSRPHSRGSTTSTRSAASGVRLGAIYSVAQGAGYSHRQKGMKQQGGLNGLTSLGMGSGESKRGTRGHSPSSVTTTSSQSSRRTGSIQLAPPTQHQLPQRPDWAANNVPYHPSPMLGHAPVLAAQSTGATVASSTAGPNVSEFPPLLRASTAAEPMQVERAKAKQLNGTVWNGSLHHSQPSLSGASAASVLTAQSISAPPTGLIAPGVPAEHQEFERVTILPGPSRTPGPHAHASGAHGHGHVMSDADPDFPRRVPGKSAPTLYDPSASGPSSTRGAAPALVPAPAPASSRPTSAAAVVAGIKPPAASQPAQPSAQDQAQTQSQPQAEPSGKATGPSPEEIIEAKLAAVSINAGVSIGPPPVRPPVASYAKIVRRD
ncbi:hypothetical protein IAT38_002912 [Cryptococcus sp. DSM 104549]